MPPITLDLDYPALGPADANGHITLPNGQITDQWGNIWNPTTGSWYNPQGQRWVGTDAGTGVGVFDGRDLIGTNGSPVNNNGGVPSLSDFLDFGGGSGGSGGGGSSGPGADYYAAQISQGQQQIDNEKAQNQWQNDFDTAKFNWEKAQSDKDYALAVGDLELARQKQSDANYWQGKTIEAQERMNSQDNQTSIATAQIGAQAQLQSAAIAAEADRYAAQTRLQEGLANAHNDAERNRVMLAHEQEMAAIARMEDETKRAIAAQENQIQAFDAETSRAAQMGDLALKNNQFIHEKSINPRDLFGLYFMQRGLTPDWDTMMSGGQLPQGDPLTVKNPMSAYKPVTQLPTDFKIGNGQMGAVGQASQISLAANPFMNMGMVTPPSGGGGGGASLNMGGISMPNFSPSPTQSQGMPPQLPTDINPGGLQGGVPVAGLRPGMNLSTVGSDITGADFNTGTAYYDQGKTRPVNPEDVINRGTQVWIDYGVPRAAYGTQMPRYPFGTKPVGSMPQQRAPMSNLSGGNPNGNFATYTNVPQKQMPQGIQGTNMADFGVSNTPKSTMPIQPVKQAPVQPQQGFQGTQPQLGYTTAPKMMVGDSPAPNPNAGGARPEIIYNPTQAPIAVQPNPQTMMDDGPGAYADEMFIRENAQQIQQQQALMAAFQQFMARYQQPRQAQWSGNGPRWAERDYAPRFALGTDVSQDYVNNGMGSMYLQSSSNPGLAGMQLPRGLQALADYGVPISPSLASSATGGIMPTLNTANAFNARGGGVLPSLQTFAKQTKGETENFRGYAEGVIGVPWTDIVDYLGKPTQMLGQAKRAQGGMF